MDKMYKIELHVHTCFSHDSNLILPILYRQCIKNKIDCIAITDHNNIDGAVAFNEYCKKNGSNLKVIIGEEIMTTDGEIIGLFLSKNISAGMSPVETIDEIIHQGGIVYIPHPYDKKRCKTVLKEEYIKKYKDKISCIECHNGRNIKEEYTNKQEEIANKYRLKKIVGEDAHIFLELGRNFIYMNEIPDTSQKFLQGLDAAILHKSKCRCWVHIITKIDKIIKFLIKGDLVGMYKFIIGKIRRIM